MKRIASLLLFVMLATILAACGGGSGNTTETSPAASTAGASAAGASTATESTAPSTAVESPAASTAAESSAAASTDASPAASASGDASPAASASTAAGSPAASGSAAAAGGTADLAAAAAGEACKTDQLVVWTKEGGADLAFYTKLVDEFNKARNTQVQLVNKDVENLRQDFQTAAVAGSGPDLLWTVADHAGPFTAAGLIQSVDQVGVDTGKYVEVGVQGVTLDGKTWGIPLTVGNQLLLLYNKKLIPDAPKTTEDLLRVGKEQTDASKETFGLVYNQTEPFWLVPWLGGFGGQVFGEDGKTPTLNTPAMVNSLKFLKQLKDEQIVPAESDYNTADALFQEGKAAMIINGEWSLASYAGSTATVTATQNLDLGIAPMPEVTGGKAAAPYTAGTFFMFPKNLSGDKLDCAKQFIDYMSSEAAQVTQATTLKRLPAVQAVLEAPQVKNDPLLAGTAAALPRGTPQPIVAEMRCNFDAMKPNMQDVLAGKVEAEAAAEEMQAAAETCVQDLQ